MEGNDDESNKKSMRWEFDSVELLVDLWSERVDELRKTQKKIHIFQEIANELNKCGFNCSPFDVQRKIDLLSAQCRKYKDSGVLTGNRWHYYKKLRAIVDDNIKNQTLTNKMSSQITTKSSQARPEKKGKTNIAKTTQSDKRCKIKKHKTDNQLLDNEMKSHSKRYKTTQSEGPASKQSTNNQVKKSSTTPLIVEVTKALSSPLLLPTSQQYETPKASCLTLASPSSILTPPCDSMSKFQKEILDRFQEVNKLMNDHLKSLGKFQNEILILEHNKCNALQRYVENAEEFKDEMILFLRKYKKN